jgi:hypothetical protein
LIPGREQHPNLVIVTVPDEVAIYDFSERLDREGIRHRLFTEADMDSQATALATEPVSQELRKVFRDLPLLE